MRSSDSFLEHLDKMEAYKFFCRSNLEAEIFAKGSDIYLYQNPIFFQKHQQFERVLHRKIEIP
jgi:hypothetical protein